MKNLLYIFLIALTAIPVLGQGQNKSYLLAGTIPAPADLNKAELIYKINSVSHVDSANIVNGKFQFKGLVDGPVRVSLLVGTKAKGMMYQFVELYLLPGKLTLSSPDSLQDVQVFGGIQNAENNELWKSLLVPSRRLDSIRNVYESVSTLQSAPPKERVRGLDSLHRILTAQRLNICLNFVKSHPNSVVSLSALSQYVGRSSDYGKLVEAENLFQSLSPEVQSSRLGREYGDSLGKLKRVAIGAIAPDFSEPDTTGKPIFLHDFRGKYVLIDFWASWCGPCRAENPNLVKAIKRFGGENFTVFGVSLDDDPTKAKWLKAIRDDKLFWPQVCDLKGVKENVAAVMYEIVGIPQNVLVDPNGKIVAKNLRGEFLQQKLSLFLKPNN